MMGPGDRLSALGSAGGIAAVTAIGLIAALAQAFDSSEPAAIVKEAALPGPTVVVVAGIHGNEPAGVVAAERIAQWEIRRGRLAIIPRANPQAIDARRRGDPRLPSEERDLNRNFLTEDKRCTPRGGHAQKLWAILEPLRPDWLVDLHESADFRRSNPRKVGNSLIICPDQEVWSFASRVLPGLNGKIAAEDQKFVLLRWPAGGSLARAAAEVWGTHSLIVETTLKDPLSQRVEYHCFVVQKLLQHLEMIEALPRLQTASGDAP